MDKIIKRLLDGQFEYDQGTLDFSESRLELKLKPGEEIEGAFVVFGPEGRAVEGYCLSSELRMRVLTPFFSGSQDTVSYRFHARGLRSGDVLKGNFRIISNRGEYLLPFVVTVEMAHVESELGEIRNLYHFANLAKTDWDEAVSLFYSDSFEEILSGNEASFRSVYRGLSANKGDARAMEEFLLTARKKQPVEYLADRGEIRLDNPEGSLSETIVLTRNGWGYTGVDVTSDGDFIELTQTRLTAEDFTGNTCRYDVLIHPERLHDGMNYGAVIFTSPYGSVRVRVIIRDGTGDKLTVHYLDKKAMTIEMVRLYESFRCRRISSSKWLTEAGELVNRMMAMDGSDMMFRLYHAHYLITASRTDEGEYQLSQIAPRIESGRDIDDDLRCYYLYLTTLCSRDEDEIADVSARIEKAFHRHPDSWRIAWLLQFVSEEFSFSPSRKWDLFKDQFARGCRSPIIYIEAMQLLAAQPSMMMRLDAFTVQMLRYCARKGFLTDALIERSVYLISRAKGYDEKLFEILCACYRDKSTDVTLEVLCAMLIKGNRTDPAAFTWYAAGIEKGLRLTRLYEYYMMSMETDGKGALTEEIPKSVLMYFSYQSDLDYRRNAMLCRYVTEHRDAVADLYEAYTQRIPAFLYEQIDRMRIDQNLGYLYKKYLEEDMVSAANAKEVLTLLHTALIRITDPRFTEVVVVYDRLTRERTYPVVNGEAYVPLFGSDYAILLSDEHGDRYAMQTNYEIIKLIIPGRLGSYAVPYIVSGEENVDLYLSELGTGSFTVDMENVARFRELSNSDALRKESRLEIRDRLIRFYYDNDFTRQLTELLQGEDPGRLSASSRSDLLEMMVLTGECEQALEWLREYGTYGVDPKIIVRMCSRFFDRETYASDLEVVEIVASAFRGGKYDNEVLEFLVAGFEGTVREMRDVFKAAVSFGVETFPLSERILKQMLYTGAYVGERTDIYRDFVRQGGESEMETAFLAATAYDHLVKDKITNEYYYQRIALLASADIVLPDVCKMDYLKFYAENNREEMSTEVAEKFLRYLLGKEICFPFYLEYQDVLKDARRFGDRVFLQYRTVPGRRVTVHYMMSGEKEGTDYTAAEMREMYDSIYVASFILFFGEEVQYYITEESRQKADEKGDRAMEHLTESGTLSRSDIRQGTHTGRFSIINDMMIAATLQDYETFDRLAQDYYRTKYMVDKLFTLKGESNAV